MTWLAEAKDLIAVAVATLAVILSLITVLLQTRHRRDAYREMYDVLMSPDLHRGRWAIVDIQNETQIPMQGSPDYFLIYRTLGVLSVLATYARHRIVPRRLVLEVWGYSLLDMHEGAKIMRDAEINRLNDSRPRTGCRGRTCGGCTSNCQAATPGLARPQPRIRHRVMDTIGRCPSPAALTRRGTRWSSSFRLRQVQRARQPRGRGLMLS